MYNINDIKEMIKDSSLEKMAIFYHKTIPGDIKINGMRIGDIHKLSKKIYKDSNESFLNINDHSCLELDIIHGDIIAYNDNIDVRINSLKEFIPYINNWLVLDNLVSRLKINENKQTYFKFINEYLNSDQEYIIRFIVVMYLYYFLEDEYIDIILDNINHMTFDKYYASMGAAWMIAEAYIKYPSKIINFLKNNNLDKFTHNKAISKINDSYRIDDKTKLYIKTLRKER